MKLQSVSKQNNQSSPYHFICELNQQALNHRALNHPYLRCIEKGDFENPTEAIKDLTYQYLAYSKNFLRYLTVTISKLQRREHREKLLENLMEESGLVPEEDALILEQIGIDISWVQGVSHPKLYTRFLDAIGFDSAYRMRVPFCDESRIWSKLFLKTCSIGNVEQAIGAIGIGTENIVKHVYRPILGAIKNFLNVESKDRVFFDLHALLDDEHGEVLNFIAEEHATTIEQRKSIRDGMLMALQLRAGFFDAMFSRTNFLQEKGVQKLI